MALTAAIKRTPGSETQLRAQRKRDVTKGNMRY